MTEPRISQLGSMVLSGNDPQPVLITQLASMVLSGPPDTPVLISQLAVFILVSDARGVVTLENPIALDCWQPCTQYGTYSTIIYLGN